MRTLIRILLCCVFSIQIHSQVLFQSDTLVRRSRTYDVVHYAITVSFDETQRKVFGTTTIRFTPLASGLDSIVLDAVALDVKSVRLLSGTELKFSNRSPALAIYLDHRYSLEDTVTVAVKYSCVPLKGLYFIQPDSSNPTRRWQIWTQGEDEDNRYWFPCYDFPNDKATSEVTATVRDSYTLVSNGHLLAESHDKKNKTRTFHWSESKPHSSYLIMLAAGDYKVVRERCDNVPIEYYVYKDRVDDGMRSLAKTKDIMKFFQKKIGYPYPWEKYSQIFISDFMYGGMENTSVVTLNDDSYLQDTRSLLDFTSDDVVAHELSHQWWGDLVTCRDWTHLWLNEGFASFFASVFGEYARGKDDFQYGMMQAARSIVSTEQAYGRKPIVSRESYTTNLYSKGSWVLNMLRNLLGEKEFWEAIKYYAHRHEYRNADTHEFELAIEDATGQNLGWFFKQWVYKAGHPMLNVTTTWTDSTHSLLVTIAQNQTLDSLTDVFVLPIDIECATSTGKSSVSVRLTHQRDSVSIVLSEKPLMVIVDKGNRVLKSLTFEKSKEEYVYQLLHAEDVTDRIAAAKALRTYTDDDTVFTALRRCALNDVFWGVRREATISLGVMKTAGVKETLFELYKDKNSQVRNAAVVALESFKAPDVARFVESAAQNDSSYLVVGSCIGAMEKVDSTRAFEFARRFVDQDSYRDIIRRASLGVFRRSHLPQTIPYAIKYGGIGSSPDIRSQALGILSEVGKEDSTARRFVVRSTQDGIASIRTKAIEVLQQWGGEDAKNIISSRKQVEKDPAVLKTIESALDSLSSKPPEQ